MGQPPSRRTFKSIQLFKHHHPTSTVMIQSFWTDRSGQTVQTQIRLLIEEQFDKGLHCLLFLLHLFDKIPSGLSSLFDL